MGASNRVDVSISRYRCSSMPALATRASASPRDSMTAAPKKLPLSFTRLADFGVSETTKVLCPMASSRGVAKSTAADLPAAITKKRPRRCDLGPAKHGCRDELLPSLSMFVREPLRQGYADCARRDMQSIR